MRVIECDICGEVVSAADDEELVGALEAHVGQEHPDAAINSDEARRRVGAGAYEATDS